MFVSFSEYYGKPSSNRDSNSSIIILADKLTSAETDRVLMDGCTCIYLPYLVKSSAVNFEFNS